MVAVSGLRLKSIKLEVTHCCPLACVHCSSNAHAKRTFSMSYEFAESVSRQAIALGVQEIALSGGEPLLWPRIADIVYVCSSAGMQVELYSSGNVVNQEARVAELADRGIAALVFSVYAASSGLHDAITATPGSFDKTMTAVKAAVDLHVDVEFHFVPLSTNYDQLQGIVQLAQAQGVKKISVLRFVPQGRGATCETMMLNREENLTLRRLINEGRAMIEVRAGSPYNFLMVNHSPKCLSGIDRLTVLPDSTIYPCDAFKQVKATEIVGTDEYSRLDKWSLEACWKNSPYLKAVRTHLTTPFEAPCKTCTYLSKCLSGCLAQKYIEHGTLAKVPDPMCLHNCVN